MQNNIKIKKHYRSKFTQIDNMIINDMTISFQAKGVFLYLFSKPDDWQVNVKAMQYDCVDKQTKIYSALKELENAGYLIRKRFYENGKIAGIIYNLSDTKEWEDKDNINQEPLNQENLNQVDTDEYIYNTKKEDTKKEDTKKENSLSCSKENDCLPAKDLACQKFKKPTVDEIKDYCLNRNNNIDAEAFYHYYETVGWKVGSKTMKSWQSAIITWEKRSNKIYTKDSVQNNQQKLNVYDIANRKNDVLNDFYEIDENF